MDKFFKAASFYRKWRDDLIEKTAIDYLRKTNPSHHEKKKNQDLTCRDWNNY